MNPFPLQSNLEKLKPNVGKRVSTIIFLIIFLIDRLYTHLKETLNQPAWIVLIAVAVIGLLIFIFQAYGRTVYFNSSGIGIASRFGGATWYAYDGLLDAKLSYRRIRGERRLQRMRLRFHTGAIKLSLSLYQPQEVNRLAQYVEPKVMRLATQQPVSAGPGMQPPRGKNPWKPT